MRIALSRLALPPAAVFVLLFITCAPEGSAPPPAETRPGQHPHRFETTVTKTLETNYLLYLPESYGHDDRLWPLLVHLHGGGGVGDDVSRLSHYPLVERLEREPDFPFVVVTPQCPMGERMGHGPIGDTWTEHADLVDALIDELLASYRIDPDRVVLVGHSMGGYGAWYLAHRFPRRFAAVAPMSGPAVPWWTYRPRDVPFWVFHGAQDEAVPIEESEEMVESLKEIGGDVRFTRYPEGGHAIREPFDGDELYEWLLEQRRPEAPAGIDGSSPGGPASAGDG